MRVYISNYGIPTDIKSQIHISSAHIIVLPKASVVCSQSDTSWFSNGREEEARGRGARCRRPRGKDTVTIRTTTVLPSTEQPTIGNDSTKSSLDSARGALVPSTPSAQIPTLYGRRATRVHEEETIKTR